jgi:hypothetical protein
MMKRSKQLKWLSLSIAASLSLSIGAANAQTSTPQVDKRQAHQQQRIGQGIQSGQLTPREAVRLEKGQARVQTIENRAKADGVVTANERAHMKHAQKVQSRKIYRQKHDGQRSDASQGISAKPYTIEARRRGYSGNPSWPYPSSHYGSLPAGSDLVLVRSF